MNTADRWGTALNNVNDEFHNRLNAIALDRKSGASAIALKAALIAIDFLQKEPSNKEIKEFTQALHAAQPSMAPLLNLGMVVQNSSLIQARQWLTGIERSDREVAKRALRGFSEPSILMTHSRSSNVERVVKALFVMKKLKKLYLTESQPEGEGITFYQELLSKGLPVELLKDEEAIEKVSECDALLLGADAVTSNFVIAKKGSRTLAMKAKKTLILAAGYKHLTKEISRHLKISEPFEKVPRDTVSLV